ncbi:MmyB family transcriptional regulator [Streptomyces lichenis]|uniref:MmyB-like transcription regulator ligand binding domain-containing protein n=1 Tax=Streptomyces lichenis TaxID=2306967 RepID=A0ABT0IJV6_9ACTN|nr:hypothetical protein [Streptomyces lichenis]MCK8681621.1 hypothetical protein [Streptomyces lichenis]
MNSPRRVFPDWQALATEAAGRLRASAGRFPDDRELTWLIGELSAHSEEFRRVWATGEVVMCDSGRRRLHHPATGTLHLDHDALHIPAAPGETGLVLHVLSAEHGTPEEAALTRLAATLPAARHLPQAAPNR